MKKKGLVETSPSKTTHMRKKTVFMEIILLPGCTWKQNFLFKAGIFALQASSFKIYPAMKKMAAIDR
jgi:hypothetical protein